MLLFQQKIEEFCQDVIDPRIDSGGLDHGGGPEAPVLFYAGPSPEVLDKISDGLTAWEKVSCPLNWQLAAGEAERLGAKRLDDTPLFMYLRSKDFDRDFDDAFGDNINPDLREDIVKEVWDYVSDRFAHTNFKKAATLVCGANRTSSFYKREMLGMLEGDLSREVNERAGALFRELQTLGADEVHRVMAATHVLNMKAHARASNDPQARESYKRQRKYFVVWREDKDLEFAARPKEEKRAFKQTRAEILTRHKANLSSPIVSASHTSIPLHL